MHLFFFIVLSIWAGLNGYAFWRLSILTALIRLPPFALWALALVCWLSLPASRWARGSFPRMSDALDVFSTTWLGVLFLLCLCFLAVDCATLGGFVFRNWIFKLRLIAVVAATGLSVVALIQGTRNPVIREQTIVLPGLPRERDGLRLVFISDMHLGTQIGRDWLNQLVEQITLLKPDLIAIGGDLVDHDAERVQAMTPELRRLRAPLGVWAVLGNHDVYSGPDQSSGIMEAAGFHVLHDESIVVATGLRIAGVDDLGVRGRAESVEPVVRKTLNQTRRGLEGCVFLSHTPISMTAAAEAGAGLMLCGHTHGGQIWPFNYLVKMRFPTIAGLYDFGDMKLIVSRGAGTWGPRMRLWRPGEIWLVTLRASQL